MHGLINRAIERFARDTYGGDVWIQATRRMDLGFTEVAAMLHYDDAVTTRLLQQLADLLDKPAPDLLEDIGTYLVSHPNVESLRRLLRFGGVTFEEFLLSLDDLPGRGRLAVPDLDLPRLELVPHTDQCYALTVFSPKPATLPFGRVVMGLLRAMADDYGALVVLDYKGDRGAAELIEIRLLEPAFAEGRHFDLGATPP
jgi:hypothetical protein